MIIGMKLHTQPTLYRGAGDGVLWDQALPFGPTLTKIFSLDVYNNFILWQAKKEKVKNLRDMNSDAEKLKSFGEYMGEDFQRK